jgi:hypothetical protein
VLVLDHVEVSFVEGGLCHPEAFAAPTNLVNPFVEACEVNKNRLKRSKLINTHEYSRTQ